MFLLNPGGSLGLRFQEKKWLGPRSHRDVRTAMTSMLVGWGYRCGVCVHGGGVSTCVCVLVRQACIIMPHEEGERPALLFSP